MLSGIQELLSGLRHDRYSDVDVTMVKAFVDDSGSGGDSAWFVLAGYMASAADWDSFDAEWRAVLDDSPRIVYFKSSEAESLRPDGQWAGVTKEQRDAKIEAFVKVIQKRARHAFVARVKQKHYNRIIRANGIPEVWDDPYYFLFLYILSMGASAEKYFGSGEPLEFVFDSSERMEKPSRHLYGQYQKVAINGDKIVNVVYRDEKLFLPLQAADLLAWQVRRRLCVAEPMRRHLREAQKCLGVPPVLETIVAEHDLFDLLQKMKENERAYLKSAGLPPETNLWIKKKKKR